MFRGVFFREFWLVFLLLTACSVHSSRVSASDPTPTVDGMHSFEVGSTSKNTVIELFGEPNATFNSEATFAYFADELRGGDWLKDMGVLGLALLGLVATGNPQLGGGWHFLILTFDERDVLMDYQHEFSDHFEGDCISAGWCVKHGRIFRLADEGEDTRAKQFDVANHACGIYIFGRFQPEMTLYLNGTDKGGVFSRRYFQLWAIDPGLHEIEIRPQPGLQNWDWSGFPRVKFDCIAGEAAFVRLDGLENIRLSHHEDSNSQRKQIKKRTLILSGPAFHNRKSD